MTVWNSVSSDARIIIIHPNYRYQRQLLSTMDITQEAYWRFDEDLKDIKAWHLMLQESFSKAKNLIILDEFDRLHVKTGQNLLKELLQRYEQIRIIIFSRNLPTLDDSQLRLAALYPVDEKMLMPDYFKGRDSSAKKQAIFVEVFGFGRGAIVINGQRLDNLTDWQRLYFFYLLHEGATSRANLLEIFGADPDLDFTEDGFTHEKSKLDKLFGRENRIIVYRGGNYQINPDLDLRYDLRHYEECFDKGEIATDTHKVDFYVQSRELYQGAFLTGTKGMWVQSIREKFHSKQAEISAYLAKRLLARDETENALALFSEAFNHHPVRDDIVGDFMNLCIKQGKPCTALELYERHAESIYKRFQIEPVWFLQRLSEEAQAACDSAKS